MFAAFAAARALERPTALDLRVDALTTTALLSEPATSLVDPDRQAAAIRRTHWTVVGFVLAQIFEAVALIYLWSSGGAAALRDWLRRRIRSEWNARFLFGAALALVARLAAFIPAFYLYRVDHTLGLTYQLTRYWTLYWILHTMLAMVIAGLIAAIVLWLVERSHQWYVYAIVGILAASVAWSYVSLYLPSSDSRIVRTPGGVIARLPDQLLPGRTPTELEYEAVEANYLNEYDRLSIAFIEGGIIIVFAAVAIVIADRLGFRRDDDSLSRLALVGALLALVYLAAVPVRNAVLRSYYLSADADAVVRTGNPAAAVRALIRDGDQRMVEVCPEWSAMLFLYTTPGVGSRVAAINHVRSSCH
jgi:hypothetical protein